MFKVEKPEYVNKTFRIDKKLLEKLDAIAHSRINIYSPPNICERS